MKYFLFSVLLLAACTKDSDSDSGEKDWHVRIEITSPVAGDRALFHWSNGEWDVLVGNYADYNTWPLLPWVKDTVFKRADGSRTVMVNVKNLYNPGNATGGENITSRIYINDVLMKEAKSIDQFLTVIL